jgi:DNA repair protein RecN (Recombination protein N)
MYDTMEFPSFLHSINLPWDAPMLRFLSVKNLAVVEELDIEFQSGLTVITGETGAGKSIILGAFGLLVGARASGDLIRTGAEKAVVQATIDGDEANEVILRREVTSQGRSRAFIDDKLATIGALQTLGKQVIDLHGQHEHQSLLDPATHCPLVDTHGNLTGLAETVAEAFRIWNTAARQLEQQTLSDKARAERLEFLRFQLEEIDEASLQLNEDQDLTVLRSRLAHAEKLSSLCADVYGSLYEHDNSILSQLGQIWRKVGELADIDPSFLIHLKNRDSVEANLEDLAFFLRSYKADMGQSPEQLGDVETRLALIERLKKKYGPGLNDIFDHREKAVEEVDRLKGHAEQLKTLLGVEETKRQAYLEYAQVLSAKRRRAATDLQCKLKAVLESLSMPSAVFETVFTEEHLPRERWSENGIDEVEFFFSANPGEAAKPLGRVASGGEVSRLMLALKTVATVDEFGKTLIFDEIDAGIGGSTANKVAMLMKSLSERFQVICVTHLPQIAASADCHFHVSKSVEEGATVTRLEKLSEQSRVAELARLMTGAATEKAVAGARELLKSKQKTKA